MRQKILVRSLIAAGVIAAVIWLSAPWIPSLATTGYNEGPVALYALLAIYALWLALRDEKQSHQSRFVLLAGFLAGSAVACKYPPLLFVVFPLFLWIAAGWCCEFVWSLVIGYWSLVRERCAGSGACYGDATLFDVSPLFWGAAGSCSIL